jgi:hypothetical protein
MHAVPAVDRDKGHRSGFSLASQTADGHRRMHLHVPGGTRPLDVCCPMPGGCCCCAGCVRDLCVLVLQVLHRCEQVVLHHSQPCCHSPSLLQQGHFLQHAALEANDAANLHTHGIA